jgi:hypothetical protein
MKINIHVAAAIHVILVTSLIAKWTLLQMNDSQNAEKLMVHFLQGISYYFSVVPVLVSVQLSR